MNDDIVAAKAVITPVCRANRGVEGAIDEALRRVRETYMDCVLTEANAKIEWHVELIRVEKSP